MIWEISLLCLLHIETNCLVCHYLESTASVCIKSVFLSICLISLVRTIIIASITFMFCLMKLLQIELISSVSFVNVSDRSQSGNDSIILSQCTEIQEAVEWVSMIRSCSMKASLPRTRWIMACKLWVLCHEQV